MIHARTDYDPIQDPRGKIGENEPVFLVRAQDTFFLEMLFRYLILNEQNFPSKAAPIRESLLEHIKLAAKWRHNHLVKLPDMPHDAVRRAE